MLPVAVTAAGGGIEGRGPAGVAPQDISYGGDRQVTKRGGAGADDCAGCGCGHPHGNPSDSIVSNGIDRP